MLIIGTFTLAIVALVAAFYSGWQLGGIEQRQEMAALQKELFDSHMEVSELKRLNDELAEIAKGRVVWASERFADRRAN